MINAGGTALASWLSSNFSNVFGNVFSNGTTVADFYPERAVQAEVNEIRRSWPELDEEIYGRGLGHVLLASNRLAGNVAAAYGFNVTGIFYRYRYQDRECGIAWQVRSGHPTAST